MRMGDDILSEPVFKHFVGICERSIPARDGLIAHDVALRSALQKAEEERDHWQTEADRLLDEACIAEVEVSRLKAVLERARQALINRRGHGTSDPQQDEADAATLRELRERLDRWYRDVAVNAVGDPEADDALLDWLEEQIGENDG